MSSADQDKLIRGLVPDPAVQDVSAAQHNRKRKLELLRDLAVLRFSGQVDALLSHLTEDCEMYVSGDPASNPVSGRTIGRVAIGDKLRMISRLFEFLEAEAVSIIVENDDLAIRWKCQARNRRQGSAEWIEGMCIVTFRENLLAYYGNFIDTAALGRLVDLKQVVPVS